MKSKSEGVLLRIIQRLFINLQKMLAKSMDISENHYSNSRKTLWVLALFCIAAFFLFLGSALFNTRGEPREAIVAVSMLENKPRTEEGKILVFPMLGRDNFIINALQLNKSDV